MAICGFFGEYRFLSNFWESEFKWCGYTYKTVEHAYQASKVLSKHQSDKIRNAKSAREAKRIGRNVYIREDFDDIKFTVMYKLVRLKFFSNKELAEKLLATGDQYLEETNTWKDTYWGVCDGIGENNLGKILMRVREELNEY